MRLRYNLENKDDGLLLIEAEPQQRSIFVYSQTKSTIRVPFPHILFVVRYKKVEGKIVFPGIYGSGLRVFGRLTPLESLKDSVFMLPTDTDRGGLVCTDHTKDNRQFKSITEMAMFVITMWWGHYHNVQYQPFGKKAWHEGTLADVPNGAWKDAGKLPVALKAGHVWYGGGAGNDTPIPDDAELVNEEWPEKKTLHFGEATVE